ncbi:MAG: phosphonoacetaldehyde hydrolase [Candidatus Omnitrophica bacterium]|nr:MAG: Phosphonoacetaldehyde hydrolase [Candidatus Hinthialibacteria bacterium OLB16]MCE7907930.1 phosphonoacetaldehyde hydrolase [Candidatus Omnitrophica bacterium COP1]MCK6496284.1 phosphonoacetaldehyde hydrolase [bacterium]MCL4734418.1 phosphonoacetaldehyde hydrolase [Candidatus Omnitrophota bacterium]NUP93176.1 phosphonoacetaldehyde hydrolase [Candidatus Omnitrophota bacterium]
MDFVFQRSYRGPLKAVLLDWAGTTMDYGCMAPAVVFIEVYRRKGVDITIDQAREPMGAHKRVHIQQIARIPAVAERWREVHGKPIGESDIDALFADFIPLQLDCLADYADLIPGTLEAVADFRRRGLKVGSTTGYTNEMMVLLQDEARKRGYVPDSTVCATDVPAGRPHPWMCLKNAFDLGIYPMESYVKVGDTLPDIAEGLNAGMWTIGLAKTGNEMGYQEKDVAALEPAVYDYKIKRAYERMAQAGAHYVVDSISEVPALLDEINQRLKQGERP